jgi:hypothetical protein
MWYGRKGLGRRGKKIGGEVGVVGNRKAWEVGGSGK